MRQTKTVVLPIQWVIQRCNNKPIMFEALNNWFKLTPEIRNILYQMKEQKLKYELIFDTEFNVKMYTTLGEKVYFIQVKLKTSAKGAVYYRLIGGPVLKLVPKNMERE